jgi:hypothetical protein
MHPADDHNTLRRPDDPSPEEPARHESPSLRGQHAHADFRGGDLNDVAASVRRLEARLVEAGKANTLSRWLLTAGSLALTGLMVTFGLSLWKGLEQRITEEKLQAALMAKVDRTWPRVSQKLTEQVMAVVPEYGTLAVERGEKVWPELSTRLATEAADFADGLEKDVRDRSEQAVKRVSSKLAADLKTDFPKLDEQRIDALAAKLQEGLIGEGGVLAEELQAILGREQERITAMFAKLPVEKLATLPEERLQRDFIHHVLMLVDAMVVDEPGSQTPRAPLPPESAAGREADSTADRTAALITSVPPATPENADIPRPAESSASDATPEGGAASGGASE